MTWEMNYYYYNYYFHQILKGSSMIKKKKTTTCFCFGYVHISASQHKIFYHCAMLEKIKMKQFGKRKEKKKNTNSEKNI